jgi:hypothetical protein
MKWIDAGDIRNWITGKQRHCAQTLPELVRRLILATANCVEEIDFPSGDSIATGGWDGRLKTPVVSPFFPNGTSGWEIGVEKSPGKKAEADYIKRTADSLGLTLNETSFVFVTPRSWPGHGKWQNDKRITGTWKDVRVINADGLEQWLDSAPAVALWLARQIGKVVSGGIRDLENVWEEWSLATNPIMTTDLVISGRTREVEEVQKWIVQKPGILEVQGDSPDEAFAFLYAAVATLPETERIRVFSRCVVVENINELRQCTEAFQNPLIIAAPGQCIEAAGAAVAKGHHVFLSMDAKVIDIGRILRLSRPQRSIVEKNLRQNGLSEAETQRLARDFGRSIPVLRRHLFRSSAVSTPAWANAESARLLIPVLFAGSWNEEREGDRQVIEALSGMNYAAFVKELGGFLSMDDAPIRKVGSVWMLKSPLDAWFLLARHLNNDFLKLFQQSILAVLTKTDPKYDLPVEQRWAAAVYGKSSPFSEWLRTGLVESLVLLAVYGDRSSLVTSTQTFADNAVKEIFATAEKWEAWASLKDVTPLLAEAAPGTFMEAVERGIAKNPVLFQELMQDDPIVFGECRHAGLLWALESAAWSSEYFAYSVNVLSELAGIDRGGRWSNRAINSLRDIFLPGFPQTYATAEERLAALDTLIAQDPQMVWKFTRGYYSGGTISESHRFRWRDAGGGRQGLEPEDAENNRKYVNGLLPKLSDLACARENLISTADEFTSLPSDIRARLLTVLETIDPVTFSKEERSKLLECIREALNWVNSYGDEERRAQVTALNRVLERFTPEDVLERVSWLLSTPWPRLPQGEPKEYDAKDTAVRKAQEEATREVLDKVPLDKILEYAGTLQYVGVLGRALGKVVRDDKEDAAVLDAMLGHIADKPILLRGYAEGRVETEGPRWIDRQIERMKAKGNFSAEACALLYFGLPEGSVTWSAVSAHGKDVENAYWKQVSGYSRSNKTEDAAMAVGKLLDVKRPDAALSIAGVPHLSLPSPLLQRLLQEVLMIDPKDKKFRASVMDAFHLGHIFNQLYERNELPVEEIAKLEWPFAALFDDLSRYTSSPLAIHRVLQKDPSFFAQLVSFTYKRDDHAPDPGHDGINKERTEKLAHNAREVLDSWRLMPGLRDDGNLDEKELTEWVEAARQQCAMTNHLRGGDLQIAFMLSCAPSDSDGTWPHVAVRNLIERLNNKLIDKHIPIGILNRRGVVSRGLNDGGRQERELAERYKKMSDAVRARWPRTAAVIRSIAEFYEQDAKREDIDSDLYDLRSD